MRTYFEKMSDFGKELRHVGAERRVEIAEPGLGITVLDQLVRHLLQLLELDRLLGGKAPCARRRRGHSQGCNEDPENVIRHWRILLSTSNRIETRWQRSFAFTGVSRAGGRSAKET